MAAADSILEAMAKSAARSIGSQIGREVLRGVLGSILGGSGAVAAVAGVDRSDDRGFDRAATSAGWLSCRPARSCSPPRRSSSSSAFQQGADPVSLLGLRMLFALPFFIAVLLVAAPPRPGASHPRQAGQVFAMGVLGYYLSSFLDFIGLQYVGAGLERIILYLNPTLVLLGSVLFLKRRIRARGIWALGVTYAGVLVVFWHDLSWRAPTCRWAARWSSPVRSPTPPTCCSPTALVERLGAIRLTAWASIVACLCCLAQSLLWDPGAMGASSRPSTRCRRSTAPSAPCCRCSW
jgi:hypothetical protein